MDTGDVSTLKVDNLKLVQCQLRFMYSDTICTLGSNTKRIWTCQGFNDAVV